MVIIFFQDFLYLRIGLIQLVLTELYQLLDKKRSNQSIFLQKCTARDRGADPVLYLQIRLHEERRD